MKRKCNDSASAVDSPPLSESFLEKGPFPQSFVDAEVLPLPEQDKKEERSCAHLLDVVVAQGPPILELLAREDQALLVRRDPLLVLDLGLDIIDGVGGLDLEGDGLARQGFDEAACVSVD